MVLVWLLIGLDIIKINLDSFYKYIMKVLFVIDQIVHGGAERILVDYYHYLEKQGVELKIFVLSGNAGQSPWTNGLNVCYGVEQDVAGIFDKLKNFLLSIRKLRRLHADFAPDAVYSSLEKSNLLVSFLPSSSKKVFSVHNVLSVQYLKITNRLIRKLWYSFIRCRYNSGKGIVLAVSEQVKEDLVNSFGVEGKRIVVVNNRVNRFDVVEKAQEPLTDFHFEEGVTYFMNIGRFSLQKAHWKLIKAFYLLQQNTSKNVQLILMGNGDKEVDIKKLINELSLSQTVHVLPFKENPYKYLAHASFFVLSSLYEGFPIVVAESASLGIPFFGTSKAIPVDLFDSREFREQCVCYVKNTNSDFSFHTDDDDYALFELMKRCLDNDYYKTELFTQIERWNSTNDIVYQFEEYSRLLDLYE